MVAQITYPSYDNHEVWAVRTEDGSYVKVRNSGLPMLFKYKYSAIRHARYLLGSRVVPVAIEELEEA